MYGTNMDYYEHLVNDENYSQNKIKSEITLFHNNFEVSPVTFVICYKIDFKFNKNLHEASSLLRK